jgi:menaquinol-cytochrome c reductase iron-sulfur subunit
MQRRSFITALAVLVHALIAVTVAIPGVRFLVAPLRSRRRRTEFVRVAALKDIAADHPTRVVVRADRADAYTRYPPGPIGAVWLRRADSDNADANVQCLQTICPHLGCAIDYAADRSAFYCPCHASEFAPDGERRYGPSPRDMDALACRLSEPDEQGERWVEVQYKEFRTGTPDQVPLM